MKRSLLVTTALLLQPTLPSGCAGSQCVHRELSDWCWHSPADDGPVLPESAAACAPPEASDQAIEHCGLLVDAYSGGFSGHVHYFDAETEEHIATKYFTDVNGYCGGFDYWYGTRIDDC